MEESTGSGKKVITKIIIIVVVLLTTVVLYFGWSQLEQKQIQDAEIAKMNTFTKLKEEADGYHHASDSADRVKAIQIYEEALKYAPNHGEEGEIKLFLGNDYFNSDPVKAVALLKEIERDKTYYADTRAYAVTSLVAFIKLKDRKFTREYIFNEEPFASMLDEQNQNHTSDLTKKRMYEYAYNIYPTALSAFYVANYGSGHKLESGNFTPEEKLTLVKEQREWIERGTALIPKTLLKAEPSEVAQVYALRAQNLFYLVTVGEGDPKVIEEGFKESIQFAEEHRDDNHVVSQGLWGRLYYALFLARIFGESRVDDIQEIIKPITILPADTEYGVVKSYLLVEKNPDHVAHHHRGDIVRIAEIDSKFKTFLINTLGWSKNIFETGVGHEETSSH